MTKFWIWRKCLITDWWVWSHEIIACITSSTSYVRVLRLEYPFTKFIVVTRIILVWMHSKMVFHLRSNSKVCKLQVFGKIIGYSIVKNIKFVKNCFFNLNNKICSVRCVSYICILESTERITCCFTVSNMFNCPNVVMISTSSSEVIWSWVHVFTRSSNMIISSVRFKWIMRF